MDRLPIAVGSLLPSQSELRLKDANGAVISRDEPMVCGQKSAAAVSAISTVTTQLSSRWVVVGFDVISPTPARALYAASPPPSHVAHAGIQIASSRQERHRLVLVELISIPTLNVPLITVTFSRVRCQCERSCIRGIFSRIDIAAMPWDCLQTANCAPADKRWRRPRNRIGSKCFFLRSQYRRAAVKSGGIMQARP